MSTYATKQAFEAYVTFLALKKHFTEKSYDFFKYNGKVKASFDKFQTKNDAYFFAKLSKKQDYKDHIVANMIINPNLWVKDILDDEKVYFEWKKRVDSLTYVFTNDLESLNTDYFSNFTVSKGSYPLLITLLFQKKISFETFTILTNISKAYDVWETDLEDKVVAGQFILRAKKYNPFLMYDRKKFSDIIRSRYF